MSAVALVSLAAATACGRAGSSDELATGGAGRPGEAGSMPDAGEPDLGDPEHIFVRAGVPDRVKPSAALRQGRLAVAFASDDDLAVGVESADGTMTTRETIELGVTWPVRSTLVATAGGYELVWTTQINQPLRLGRAVLDEEGGLVAGPTALREGPQLDCDAAEVAGKLLIACSEHEGGDVADLVTIQCDLGQTSCGAPRREAQCTGRLSRPAVIEDATGVYLFYGCNDPAAPGLYRATVGSDTTPIVLVASTGYVADGPAALADGDRHVVAWLGAAYIFDRSGSEMFPPLELYPLDGGDFFGDAPWDVTSDAGGYLFAGTPFVVVFERGHGEVRFCRIDRQWSGVSCEPLSTGLGAATLATDASRSEIVLETDSLWFTTDLARVTVDPGGPPRPARPLLQPFGDLFLWCGACDADSCDVLAHGRTLPSLDTDSEYAWMSVSRATDGSTSLGPTVAIDGSLSNVSCSSEGAAVPWTGEDGTCNVGWLDRDEPVTWSTAVDPCGYQVFAEGPAVRAFSSVAPNTQQLIVDGNASASAPVGDLGRFPAKCGSAYFNPDTTTGALVLRRWRPAHEAQFEVILEHRPAHPVDFARVFCDDTTTVLILSSPEGHEVRALVEGPSGFELARWDADPERLDWQHALVHRGRLLIEEPSEDPPAFYVVGPSGAKTVTWTPPSPEGVQGNTFRAYSDRGAVVATWNSGKVGDAWISIWETR